MSPIGKAKRKGAGRRKPKHAAVVAAIDTATRTVVNRIIADDKRLGDQAKAKGSVYVVLNGTLLMRDKTEVKTAMSDLRLVATVVHDNGSLTCTDVAVCKGRETKIRYAVVDPSETLAFMPLAKAVEEQIKELGDVVFILLGTLGDLEGASVEVKAASVTELRLDPTAATPISRNQNGSVTMKRVESLQSLVSGIEASLQPNEKFSVEDKVKVASALDALQNVATTRVSMPSSAKLDVTQTILGKIESAVATQAKDYAKAVGQVAANPSDTALRNDVLRIAYNFCSDVLQLMYLITSACDLKPVLFWQTIIEQWDFEAALNKLPWVTLGTKANLANYRQVVSNARSHAFHHILPFDSTCKVDLSKSSVRAESMSLFEPFEKKQGRGVRITDEALLKVFAEFSRAKSRDVGDDFWKANIDVMNAAHAVVKAVLDTLVTLHDERSK